MKFLILIILCISTGIVAGLMARLLIAMIAFFTNLAFFGIGQPQPSSRGQGGVNHLCGIPPSFATAQIFIRAR